MSDTIIDVGFKDFSAKRMSKCSQGIFHRVLVQVQIPTHLGLMKWSKLSKLNSDNLTHASGLTAAAKIRPKNFRSSKLYQ